MTSTNCVIVGSGVAGVTAARELIKSDSAPRVHLYNAEPVPYYPRPKLWEFIAGRLEVEKLFFQPEAWYGEQGIKLHNHVHVIHIDPAAHCLKLSDGSQQLYDTLLLACGANAYIPELPGSRLAGVFSLRTLEDARAISAYAEGIDHTVVIGGGLLGLETANSLRLKGKRASVIEFAPHLLPRQLDARGAAVLRSYLEGLGIEILTDAACQQISAQDNGFSLQMEDGRRLNSGQVIFSTGIRSRLDLAQQAGIACGKGVQVDGYLQTSAPDVFAAGDGCEYDGIVYGIIPAAMEQARAAAHNMLSPHSERYSGTLPSTRLKIAGIEFNSLGDVASSQKDDIEVIRYEDGAHGIYRRLNVRAGKIRGAIVLGEKQNIQPLKMLINAKKDVSVYLPQLSEADFDFKALALESTRAG